MQRKLFSFVFLTVVMGAFAGNWWMQRSLSNTTEASTKKISIISNTNVVNSFIEAQQLINRYYIEDLTNDILVKTSISGLLRTLDPHSNYFDMKEFQELQSEQHSQFFGIGVTINRRNDRVYVLATIENTPADKVGIRYGDAILSINGKSAIDWSTSQVMDQVRGPQGEVVEITVERAGVSRPLSFKIARDAVPLPSIRHAYMIQPGVGYVALLGGFNHTTEDELRHSLEGLRAQGMKSLILDLRNNPGGLLTQAIKVADMFLPKDMKVVSVKGRDGIADADSREYRSENSTPDERPIVVLINKNTASAAEIVAGAIQDHDRGLIVGESSFGKGLVQTVFRLPFGSGLTLTTAKYYTPSGRCIQRNYSGLSLYEYYAHHKSEESVKNLGQALSTDVGRAVYSGGGITPDTEVKDPLTTPIQNHIFNAAFEFSRQLAAGQIAGLTSFQINQTHYHHVLRSDEFVITEKVINSFKNFLKENEKFHVTDTQVTENLEYVKQLICEQLVTAAYGTESAMEVRLQSDLQTLKAIESLPAARELANSAKVYRVPTLVQ